MSVTKHAPKIQSIQALLLVFLTVVLFYLAFPSGGYGFVAWFALVPVIITLHNQQQRSAFMLGLLAGTLGWMVSIWWVVEGLAQITHSPFNIVIPFVFLFCLFSALPYAIVTWLHSRYHWGTSIFGTLKSAIFVTALINFIPHLLPGNLAHALYLLPKQIQLASIGGVALVFFVIHWVNFLLAAAFVTFKTDKAKSATFIMIALLLCCGNWLFGYFTMNNVSEQLKESAKKSLTIAMVQPNFSVNLRTRDDWQQHQQQLLHLMKAVSDKDEVQLIVLPEIPLPISYRKFPEDKIIFDQARNNKATLLTSIDFNGEQLSEQISYYNGIELIQANEAIQQYHKKVLLPFGEYLPFEKQFPFLRTLFPNAPHYKAGSGNKLLVLTQQNQQVHIMPLICYEAVFTKLVAKGIEQHSDILINTVDDAWFGDTAGRKVHFALSLFRTVEYRIPLVRVTNNGNSAVIDASGRVITDSVIPPSKIGTSITTVALANIVTIYQQYPYWFMILCLLFSSYAIISAEKLLIARKRMREIRE